MNPAGPAGFFMPGFIRLFAALIIKSTRVRRKGRCYAYSGLVQNNIH